MIRRDSSRILNKKRSYAQYHLELGQSDFLLRSCSVCGMMYACGDESDEKLHRDFHKKYYEGIRFKVNLTASISLSAFCSLFSSLCTFDPQGWRDERVVSTPSGDNCRILLVVDGDPPSHRRKVAGIQLDRLILFC